MEKSRQRSYRMNSKLFFTLLVLFFPSAAQAQVQDSECSSVKDCAAQMVRLANRLVADNQALTIRVQNLEAALQGQKAELLKTINERADALKTGSESIPAPVGNTRSATCPPGTFMTALLSQLDGGGPHGITSWIQPVCRSMN